MNGTLQIELNGQPHQVDAESTIAQLLNDLDLQPKQVAVEVNLEIVPRTQHDSRQVKPGDSIEIVTLFGGG
jgi:sulfur carrier protein